MRSSSPPPIPTQTAAEKPVPLPPPPMDSLKNDQAFMIASRNKYGTVLGSKENLSKPTGPRSTNQVNAVKFNTPGGPGYDFATGRTTPPRTTTPTKTVLGG